MSRIGRNDPCPCGSGRKYKHCCLMKDRRQRNQKKAHAGAAAKALSWLYKHYPEEIVCWADEDFAGGLYDDEAARIAEIRAQDPEFDQFFQQNLFEFLLADGRFRLGRRKVAVVDLVLGQGGPLMTAEQSQHLRHLSEQPLRLYEVTDVCPGEGLWVRDMLGKRRRQPVFVHERAGSREIRVWDTLGLRLIEVGDHLEISGAVYPLPREYATWMVERFGKESLPTERRARKRAIGHWIVDLWLQSLAEEKPLPRMMDVATGEEMLFVTDHYRVLDWDDLKHCLKAQPDVDTDGEDGWHRLEPLDRNQFRVLVTIAPAGKGRLTLFTKSKGAADAQKRWFESIAGDAVQYLCRECTDPVSLLQQGEPFRPPASRPLPEDQERELLLRMKEDHYANWIDEPLPVLDGQTPREAARSSQWRKKLMALLKDMENRETRSEAPYDFPAIWRELGLDRSES